MIQWRELIFESNLGAKLDTAIHPAASRGQSRGFYRAHSLHC